MPCLVIILALVLPRLTMVFIYLLTNWFQTVFRSWIWPLLGFIFMPYTTLAYMLAYLNSGGAISLGWVVLIVVAVLADLGNWGGGYRLRRRRLLVP